MGNSVRSTLGNLCGAEASKDPQYEEDQLPVAKPKDSPKSKDVAKAEKAEKKKKTKKDKKKNKKEKKNGHLEQIDEKKEPSMDETNKSNSFDVSEELNKTGEQSATSNEPPSSPSAPSNSSEPLHSPVTLKDQVSISDLVDAAGEDGDSDEQDCFDEDEEAELKFDLNNERQASSDDDMPQSIVDVDASSDHRNQSDNADQRSDSNSQASGTLSTSDVPDAVPSYLTARAILPEVLGISYADNIFKNGADEYELFLGENNELKDTLRQFQKSILPDKTNATLDECIKTYIDVLENDNKPKTTESGENNINPEVDMSDVNVNVQAVRIQSLKLLGIINNVRPHLEKHLSAAANVDVIEYVKGKMVEGEQLGITSKFSAPGKYRRNMRQLKKAAATLDSVENEVRDIYKSLELSAGGPMIDVSNVDTRLSPLPQDNESDIVPVTKTNGSSAGDNSTDDIFAKLRELDSEIDDETEPPSKENVKDDKANYERKLLSSQSSVNNDDPNEDKLKTLLQKSAELERSASPETMTFVIETIPEKSANDPAPRQFGPKTGSADPAGSGTKSPVNQIIVEEEEHNTLEFGKYVLVDPNTGDIQVMRNRSRSLDSLVSMTSNRSSLSRFGSFEFVTDFEINIAEKNQTQYV